MRLLMKPARVHLAPGTSTPVTVAWGPSANPSAGRHSLRSATNSLSPTRKVISVVDDWRYDGHWWEPTELRRHYYLLELDGGTQLELFLEGGAWWAARASD